MTRDPREHRQQSEPRLRRRFLKDLVGAGAAVALGPSALWPGSFEYRFRTVAIERLRDVRDWLAKLDSEGQLSTNPTFRAILGRWHRYAPRTIKKPQSLILVAIPGRLAVVTFHLDGRSFDVPIPCGYADNFDLSTAALATLVAQEVVGDPLARLEQAHVPTKTLAVQSGLAEYGKNNISYIEGHGSYYDPVIFYSDRALPDQWGPPRMMRLCKGCSICIDACPTKAITEERFVIDPGKCLTLYNERTGPMPDWIDPKLHHALIGCLRCQSDCPANVNSRKRVEKLADVSEQETRLLLEGGDDRNLLLSIGKKLSRYPPGRNLPRLRRNLRLAWANIART